MSMKTLTVMEPGRAEFLQEEKPKATGRMMLVKVKRTGICATDFSIFSGESSFVKSGQIKYPVRFGHEWSGIVEAVGEDVKDFKVGDRIVSDSGFACGECAACKAGDYAACRNDRSVGTINAWPGPFAEYMLVPEFHAYKLPDNVSYDEGALIEPTAVSLDAFTDYEMKPDTTVAVIGVGAIGMGAIWLAKYFGAKNVIAIGLRDSKLEIAKQIGADTVVNSRECDPVEAVLNATGGKGADLVIETTGRESALVQAFKMTVHTGRISIVSFYEKEITVPMDDIVHRKITVRGAAGQYQNPGRVCEIMGKNPVKLTPVITHRLPFEDCLDAFKNEEKYHNTKIKVMVEFE